MLALSFQACAPAVDLSSALEIESISNGWVDAGVVYGKKKLVPAISVRLKNGSDQPLRVLQVNALFRRVGDSDEWGSAFLTAAGSEGLAPHATTQTLALQSRLGYTSEDPGPAMLRNARFIDARVELFARYGSSKWVRLAELPVARRLIAP
jgi:hypothetical protein